MVEGGVSAFSVNFSNLKAERAVLCGTGSKPGNGGLSYYGGYYGESASREIDSNTEFLIVPINDC